MQKEQKEKNQSTAAAKECWGVVVKWVNCVMVRFCVLVKCEVCHLCHHLGGSKQGWWQ